uniref:BOD1/SHG1 domain-containing protein n=1 Tax=Oncorhynchus tshawytscha TaxID=74940 RepID=A0A8C8CZE6_ONCTS
KSRSASSSGMTLMAGLPPGDPQLVSMIVNHLKTQGLFDQFRRDCLADVDTKPAYLNLRQRVDNFVSNHLSNHTWSPHLNKNQLRNNIRQLVLQSGMLEQGVDRIVAQVVDPKIHHTFRPQVERVVREFILVEEGEEDQDRKTPEKEEEAKLVSEAQAMEVKTEDEQEQVDSEREGMKGEGEEVGTEEEAKEGKTIGKLKDEVLNKDVDPLQSPNEKHHINQKARERLKEGEI